MLTLFECDLSEATVITMFLLPNINLKLRPRLLDLKPGTRIVSNTFSMIDWEPDYEVTIEESVILKIVLRTVLQMTGTIGIKHCYGSYRQRLKEPGNSRRGRSRSGKKFQMLYGNYETENNATNITDGRINGNTISFRIDGEKYTGHLTGDKTLEGTVTSGTVQKEWVAIPCGI